MEYFEKVRSLLHIKLLIYCAVALGGCFIISLWLSPGIWTEYNGLAHTVVELIGVFFVLAAFTNTWHAYDECAGLNHLIGFVMLITGILSIDHILYYAQLMPVNYNAFIDTSLKLWMIGGIFEVILLVIISMIDINIRINKWVGVICSILICGVIILFTVDFSVDMPPMYVGDRITKTKNYLDALVMLISGVAGYRCLRRVHGDRITERERIIFGNIFVALFLITISRFCNLLSVSVTSMPFAYSHLLKVVYNLFLYIAVYKTTIKYPYKELREIDEQTNALLNSAPIGIISFDSCSRITFINTRCRELLACTQDELFGVAFEKFMAKHLNSPKDYLSPPKAAKGNDVSFTSVYKRKDGGSIKLIVSVTWYRNRIVITLRDAKKHQALENLQLQTQTILNAIENPVLIADNDNRIVMCNRSFMNIYELTPGEVAGSEMLSINKRIGFHITKPIMTQIYRDIYIGSFEAVFVTLSGKERKLLINSSVINNVDGEMIGWVSVGSDMTGLKREQEKIQQQEKLALIGNMAAGLVHEIKNPLASIKGFTQMIKQKIDNEKLIGYANIIESASEDINRIVTDFLHFAKPLPVLMQDVSINSLISSLEIIITSNTFKYGIRTSFSYSKHELPVVADERQIKQVILNIVENAIHALSDIAEPELTIITKYYKAEPAMLVIITDNGIGMTKEQLERIGTPFYTTKEKGTGLGISICNHIINEHGGSIEIESQLNKGALFTIKLPCKAVGGA